MPAAYSTGVSSSPTNLLNALAAFLTAQGWTQDDLSNEGTGRRLHAHKNGDYVNLRAAENEDELLPNSSQGQHNTPGYGILFNVGSGYDGGEPWYNQPGRPLANGTTDGVAVGMRLPDGNVVGYHLFDDGADNWTLVVETTPGKYQYIGFGPSLIKRGYTWDSAHFYGSLSGYYAISNPLNADVWGFVPGQNPGWPLSYFVHQQASPGPVQFMSANGFIRLDASVFAGRWAASLGLDTSTGVGGATIDGFTGRIVAPSVHVNNTSLGYPGYQLGAALEAVGRGSGKLFNATAFQRSLIVPLHQFYKSIVTGRWIPMGYMPSIFRFAGLDPGETGFAEKQVLSIGGDDYMLFPRFAVLKGA